MVTHSWVEQRENANGFSIQSKIELFVVLPRGRSNPKNGITRILIKRWSTPLELTVGFRSVFY